MLKQMKCFVTVVECNSFTEAAEQCYISQSAISQQIKALEEDLGVQLIIRENRKFTLTPAGEYFYHQSLILLDEAERLRKETIRMAANVDRKLRIGYLKTYSAQELRHAIAKFTTLYPDVDIEIRSGNHEELYTLLRAREVDLVINDLRRAFSDEYVNFHLFTCDCFAEISTRSTLSTLKSVHLEELKRVPCILIASKDQHEKEQEYYRETFGFKGSFVFVENLEEGRLLVAGNKGFMPVEEIATLPPAGNTIKRVPLYQASGSVQRGYFAFWEIEKMNPFARIFAEILQTYVAKRL